MGGIRRRQALGHIARVACAVGQVLPRVRIGVAVVMMVPALVAIGIAFAMVVVVVVVVVVVMIMPAAGELARRHAFGRHHLPAGEARGLSSRGSQASKSRPLTTSSCAPASFLASAGVGSYSWASPSGPTSVVTLTSFPPTSRTMSPRMEKLATTFSGSAA